MKKYIVLWIGVAGLFACQSIPKADKAVIASQQPAVATSPSPVFGVDTARSIINWTGTKPTGYHTGTFTLNQGTITVVNNTIRSGQFVINVHSLTNSDLKGNSKEKLESHLKSADFFDVAKYPTARFEITQVSLFDSTQTKSLLAGATHLISGNLTLKDQTKNITFPSVITITENTIEAKANFNIDRTQWGLNYGSDKSLQDRFIRPEVNLQLLIKARKLIS